MSVNERDEPASKESGFVSVQSGVPSPRTIADDDGITTREKGDSAGEDDADVVVDWNGPRDRANPHNWPSRKKWTHVVLVSLLALAT